MMDEPVSKTQKKRDADFLQKIGVQCIDLSLAKLELLPLTEHLYKAIVDAKSIKSHGAKRRQAQLIGKLMRAADHEAILAAFEQLQDEERATSASFHEVERWRERLLAEGKSALTEFIAQYQPQEVQQLRQLIKKAKAENQQESAPAYKALFRLIRSYLQ